MPVTTTTTWFLFCEDAHSNEVVAQALDGLQASSEFKKHDCADGMERRLYEVPDHSFASRMYRSRSDLKTNLQIFRAQDGGKPA